MPDPHDTEDGPVQGPVISMSATTLQMPPLRKLTSAKQYMKSQFGLISAFFLPPVADHAVDDIRREMFALHCMEPFFDQIIDPVLDAGPFILTHLDLRSGNIIVDSSLRICGIIDW